MADRKTERIVITKENPLVYELRIDFYVNERVSELVSECEEVREGEREYFIEHIVPESNMMLTFF